MNPQQAITEISPESAINQVTLPELASLSELGILAIITVLLIRNLVQSNEKLTQKLLEELDEENK